VALLERAEELADSETGHEAPADRGAVAGGRRRDRGHLTDPAHSEMVAS
jgi:hypothetical protein